MSQQYQFFVPESLRKAIGSAKRFPTLWGKEMSAPEWYALASLCLLSMLGTCPDVATAKQLLEGQYPAALACFRRLLEGKDL